MRRVLWVGFIVAILCSCSAQPTAQDNASGEEETAPLEETTSLRGGGLAEKGTTGPATSARVKKPEPELVEGPASRNTPTRPAVGTNGIVNSAHPLATKVGLVDVLADGGTRSMRRWRSPPL